MAIYMKCGISGWDSFYKLHAEGNKSQSAHVIRKERERSWTQTNL